VLKEIGVLRKLGISIADIRNILESTNKAAALAKCKYKMDLEVEKAMAKKECLEQLMDDYNIDQAVTYIEENIEKHFTIKEKLLQAFPGDYGMYLCIHFGQFLNGKVDTEKKEESYNKIVNYLDTVSKIEFPKELEEYLLQGLGQLEQVDMQRINSSIIDAVNNIDIYLKENKEDIEKYLEYRNSDKFKKSPTYKMQQLLLRFQQESGYYETFIENLKILSDSYRDYFGKLQVTNKTFIDKYPQVNNIYNLL
jgi:DNA-binding transcriptional MerR regulator